MRIVLAGAGFTSLQAAPLIKKALPDVHVTLITERKQHTYFSHSPELLSGKKNPEELHLDLEKFCKARDVELIIGSITFIDREQKTVHVGEARIPYDFLLLDLGREPSNPEHTISAHGLHNMLAIKHHVVGQVSKAKYDDSPEYRTFVVAGADQTGIEIATELEHLCHQLCERHLLFTDELSVVLLSNGTPANKIIVEALDDRDIEYYDDSVHAYTQSGVRLQDKILGTHTLIWTGTRPNKLVLSLGLQSDNHGVIVNEFGQTSDQYIFMNNNFKDLSSNIIRVGKHQPLETLKRKSKIQIISTGEGKALLLCGNFYWFSSCAYKFKQWKERRFIKRLQKT